MQCNPYNGCPGSAGNCEPRFVWSGTAKSGTNYYAGYLNNGGFGNSNYTYAYAFGVRCVLDLRMTYPMSSRHCEGSDSDEAIQEYPADNCYPYFLWSGTANGSSGVYRYYLDSGSLKQSGNYTTTNAMGVRCVLDLG